MAKGEPLKGVVQRLRKQALSVGVKPRLLLLDRGFYSVDVIRYLQAARYPFLMPAVVRGRKPDHPRGPSGTRVFATTLGHNTETVADERYLELVTRGLCWAAGRLEDAYGHPAKKVMIEQ